MNKRLLALLVAMLMIVVSVGAMAEDLQPATHPGHGAGPAAGDGVGGGGRYHQSARVRIVGVNGYR